MKKYFGVILLFVMSVSLVACGSDAHEKNSENYSNQDHSNHNYSSSDAENKGKDKAKNKDEETKIYELEQDGKKSVIELTIVNDSLINEKIMIEGTFESLGKSDKAKVEETLEEIKKSQEERKGVTVSYEIHDNKANMTTQTNYELMDVEMLGLKKEELDEAGEFPLAKFRIEEYKAMGYKEK